MVARHPIEKESSDPSSPKYSYPPAPVRDMLEASRIPPCLSFVMFSVLFIEGHPRPKQPLRGGFGLIF